MSDLQSTLEKLAQQFAKDVLMALRGSSLDELARLGSAGPARAPKVAATSRREPSGTAKRARTGRLARRSAGDIDKVVERIVALLADASTGLGAEALRAKLGVSSKELPRPLQQALESGRIRKEGERRATRYFAAGGTPSAKARATPSARPRGAAAKKNHTAKAKRRASR